MLEEPEKTGRKRKNVSVLTVVLLTLILALALLRLKTMQDKLAEARAEQTALEESVARQDQENRSLEAALERAEDPEYLQELARDRLGMVTPGQKDFYDVSN